MYGRLGHTSCAKSGCSSYPPLLQIGHYYGPMSPLKNVIFPRSLEPMVLVLYSVGAADDHIKHDMLPL